MKKTISLAAIAMFAVIMGMSALFPAMAVPNNEKSSATTAVCHYVEVEDNPETEIDESLESEWVVLFTSSNGAAKGHLKHGDNVIEENEDLSEFGDACEAKNN